MTWAWTAAALGLAYLLGSVPTGLLLGLHLRGMDIREHGSRNPGATNTFRVLGWKIGVMVGLIDIFKGFFAVWFLARWIPDEGLISPDVRLILTGAVVVMGHVFTVFARFRGGKGVGTAFGVFLGLAPVPSIAAFAVWALLVWWTGYVSVGSVAASVVLPALVIVLGLRSGNLSVQIAALVAVQSVLVIYRHRSNLSRLMRGEEHRFNTRRFS